MQKPEPSTPEIEGQRIVEKILRRDPDHGGYLIEITGAQGTSKTAALFAFAQSTINKHPHEKIFFREQTDAPLQVFKFGEGNYEFFVKESSSITFRDRSQRLRKADIPYRTFSTYEELYNMSPRGKITVPFFDNDHEWTTFIHYLRNVGEWVTILIDEMSDIAPYGSSGNLFKQLKQFANDMGAVRRCMMNVFYNTQSVSDVDWRIRKKTMASVYFRGAIPDKTSRVKQHAVDALQINHKLGNEAFIDDIGQFGKVRFSKIFSPNHKYQVEAHYENPPSEEHEE